MQLNARLLVEGHVCGFNYVDIVFLCRYFSYYLCSIISCGSTGHVGRMWSQYSTIR